MVCLRCSTSAMFLLMALTAIGAPEEVGAYYTRIPGHHPNTDPNVELGNIERALGLEALARRFHTETSKSSQGEEGRPRRSLWQLADDTFPQVDDAAAASGGAEAAAEEGLCNGTPAIASAVGGFAACTKVIRSCRDKEAQSSIQPPPLCSEELRLQCEASALGVAEDSPECWAVLNGGSGSCSPSDAAAIFDAAVTLACSNVADAAAEAEVGPP